MTEIQELFQRLKPFYPKQIEGIRRTYLLEDRDGRAEIESTLQILESRILSKSIENNEPILPPPPKEIINGPFQLGNVIYGNQKPYPFGLHAKELTSHICITGATGRGKTNICYYLIKDLLRENIPFCLFDFKRSTRDLLSDPIPHDREMVIYTVGRHIVPFRFNPLIPPPGIDPKTWIDRVVDLITKIQYAGFGVASLLRKAIDHVYQSVGMYQDGPLSKQPKLKDAFKFLKDYKPKARELNWMQSCLRCMEALCFGETGTIINSDNPIPLEEILTQNVVFELDALSNSNKAFFIETILTWFHSYRLHQGGDETLKHVTIVEEAHRLLKESSRQGSSHDSILDIWITEARQLGECLVILAQTPSILPALALGNTYTSICLNLKHSSDINTMSKVLLLPYDQKDCCGKLPLGKAIVKLQGRWLNSFLINVPLYPIKKGSVSDQKLQELMDPYSAVSGPKLASNVLLGRYLASPSEGKYNNENDNLNNDKMKLSENEKRLLKDIWEYPGSGVVERYKRLKMSRRKGNKTKMILFKKHLIKGIPIIIKKGKIMLLELTKTGWEELQNLNGKLIQKKRTGGAIHEYWKEQIERFYRNRGLKVIKEIPVNGGKTADLCVLNKGKRIAIEIETGKSDFIGNIKKDLKAGFDEVVSVAVDENVLERIKKKFAQTALNQKIVRLVCAFAF
ncbi:hypothetical protein BVY01_00680 [bacterium I07]|nr:hypothetical protein BVY01_00680 [bacterium I07]